jgi:hypothetical protein
MSTLTVSLAALGGVVLAGVIAHGAWQARKAGPRRPMEALPPPGTSASAGREPVEQREPVFGEAASGPAGDDPSPRLDLGSALQPPPMRRTTVRIDALIDAIATLTLDAPVSAESVL